MNETIRRLSTNSEQFEQELQAILDWDSSTDQEINHKVDKIISDIRQRGDQALIEYSNQFDNLSVNDITELFVSKDTIKSALESINPKQRQALEKAAERIKHYHEHQKVSSWQYHEADGTVLGQKVSPLDSVGLYVPGGKANYPSSVLMNSIPAKVAGVKEIVMVVPSPNRVLSPLVLAAAAIAEIDKGYNNRWCSSYRCLGVWDRKYSKSG